MPSDQNQRLRNWLQMMAGTFRRAKNASVSGALHFLRLTVGGLSGADGALADVVMSVVCAVALLVTVFLLGIMAAHGFWRTVGFWLLVPMTLVGLALLTFIQIMWRAGTQRDQHPIAGFAAGAAQAVFRIVVALVAYAYTAGIFAVAYSVTGLHDSSGNPVTLASDFFYFSVVTLGTVGYGDFVPTPTSRLVVIGEIFTGFVELALLTAALVSAFRLPREGNAALASDDPPTDRQPL